MRRLLAGAVVVLLVLMTVVFVISSYWIPPPPFVPPARVALQEEGFVRVALSHPSPLVFDPFWIDVARLEGERRAQLSGVQDQELAASPEVHALVSAVSGWGLQQGEPSPDMVEKLTRPAVERFGASALVWAIERVRALFEQALASQILGPHPANKVETGLEIPTFLSNVLKAEGLLEPPDPATWPLVGIIYRHHWSQRLCGVSNHCLLTPYEILILRRWQVERSRATLAQKRKLIRRGKSEIPDYDWLRAEVILLVQANQRAEAVRVLDEAPPSAANDALRASLGLWP